jgi:hypothetical protein
LHCFMVDLDTFRTVGLGVINDGPYGVYSVGVS